MLVTEKRLIYDEDAKQRIIALAVGHHTDTLPLDMIINVLLHQAPTVDAVEVVRCKECAYSTGTAKFCPLYRDGLMKDDDYCSVARRK